MALPVEKVKKIQWLNKKGKKPEKLVSAGTESTKKEENGFLNMVGQEDLDRFNKPKKKIRKKKRKSNRIHLRKSKKK
ncbi:MAG: hypothetical protein ACOC1D_05520 [Prolixibacteraceae bacterium]